jgi:hypothetical protein
MKSVFSFASRALTTGLLLLLLASRAFGDVSCLDGCSSQLASCTNSGGAGNCEDQYDKCVDDCISNIN